MQNKLLFLSFILVLALGILHIIAGELYLYWVYWWFDNMMHFLGGISISLFVLWLAFRFKFLSQEDSGVFKIMVTALVSIFIIGVCWEIFEYMNGLTQSTEGYVLDTAHDLFFDVLGGFCAGLIAFKLNKKDA